MGLAEICFPNGFNNISDNQTDIYLYRDLQNHPTTKQKYNLSSGFYNNGQELLKRLDNTINNNVKNKPVTFAYNTKNDTTSVVVANNMKLVMNKSLSLKLGFEINTFTSGTHVASNSTDLHFDTHYMYIYTNIVNEIPVGNSYVKLLRTVPTYGDTPERYITKTYDKPHYMNIASSFENNIEIGITTDEGNYFDFRGGKVIITLHFIKTK